MKCFLKFLNGLTVTLLLSLGSSFFPFAPYLSPLHAQAQTVQDRNAEAVRLFQRGIQQYHAGQLEEALKLFEQVLLVFKEVNDLDGEAVAMNYIGSVYLDQDQYPQALKFYQQALNVAKKVNNREEQERIHNNIGLVYSYQHQYAQSLKSFQQALVLRKKLGNRGDSGAALKNIGDVYFRLGQPSNALDYYQQALEIARKIKDRDLEGNVLNGIGFGYYELGQHSQALEFYQQSLAISRRQMNNRRGEGNTLHNLGLLHDSLGQHSQALEFYQQSLAISREINNRGDEGRTLNNIGAVYNALGQYSKALEFYQQALPILRKVGDLEFEGTTLNNIGYAQFQNDKLAEAEKTLRDAVKISESLRSGLADADKVSLFDTQVNPYRFLQQALVAQDKTDAALEVAERGRARAFVELLASKLSDNPSEQLTIKPPTIRQIQQIAREKNATLVEYSIVYDDFQVQGRKQWRESELYIWVVKPTGEVTFKSVDFESLNTNLAEAFDRRSRTAQGLRQEDTFLAEYIRGTREAIGVRGQAATELATAPSCQWEQCLQQMHQLLIEPIADLLPTNPDEHVIFIPHQSLFGVPFPALQDQNGKYLIEKHTILTAPAIQVLNLTRKQRQQVSGTKELVVGNPIMPTQELAPLPGAETEAIEIAQLLKTKAITGKQATETSIVQQMPSARIIHLATHGLLDDAQGLGVPGVIALTPL